MCLGNVDKGGNENRKGKQLQVQVTQRTKMEHYRQILCQELHWSEFHSQILVKYSAGKIGHGLCLLRELSRVTELCTVHNVSL